MVFSECYILLPDISRPGLISLFSRGSVGAVVPGSRPRVIPRAKLALGQSLGPKTLPWATLDLGLIWANIKSSSHGKSSNRYKLLPPYLFSREKNPTEKSRYLTIAIPR